MALNVAEKLASGLIRTPKAKMSFPALFTARKALQDGADPKFGVALLFPPGSDLTALKQAAQAAVKEEWPNGAPANLKNPFLKANEIVGEKGPTYGKEYEGWTLIRVNSKQKPGLVDHKGAEVSDEAQVYPGRWGRATVRAFCYNVNGNRGVTFGLQNVQLLDHDTPMAGGRTRPQEDFDSVEIAGNVGTNAGAAATGDDLFN